MRLTLRTLLAYIDDRLPPNNAKEIGQKITNSAFAKELVDRIRDVKRRRRLAAPSKPQPMIDANLVAEYLDDQLTPELVARVEREILASDAMLAEVASAHEVLGMLRDPVAVEPRLRDRLYGLDPTGNTDIIRAVGGEGAVPSHGGAAAGRGVARNATPADATNSPPQWKPMAARSTTSKRLPLWIGAVLAIVWLVFVITDSRLFRPSADDSKLVALEESKPDNDADAIEADAIENKDGAVNAPEQLAVAENVKPADAANPVNPTARPPEAEVKVQPEVEMAAAEVPRGDAGAANGSPVNPVANPPAPEMPAGDAAAMSTDAAGVDSKVTGVVDEQAEDDRVASYYVQAESPVTMVYEEKLKRWMSLAQIPGGDAVSMNPNQVDCRMLTGRHWLGVPAAFHSNVQTDFGGWRATVLGPSLMRFRGAPESGLDLLSGRVRITSDASAVWNDEAKPVFRLGSRETYSRLTLQTKDTRVTIEVTPVPAPAGVLIDDKESLESVLPVYSELQIRLNVVEGACLVTLPAMGERPQTESMVNRGQRMTWAVLTGNVVSSATVDQGEVLAAAPKWLFETDVPEVPELVALKSRLVSAMEKGGPPDESILPLLSDKNPQVGVLAVGIAHITRNIDRLLSVLYAEHDESVHRASIDALSAIVTSSAAEAALTRTSLETRLPMADIEPTMNLIVGISDAQAADPNVVADLYRMLSDESLAIRTLAIYRMEEFSKDRMGYFPENEPARRRDALRRWQRHIDRNDGKLIP